MVVNGPGLAAHLISAEVKSVLEAVAARAKERAESLSADFAETGNYSRSFETDVSEAAKSGQLRAVARMGNTAPYAAVVEWGHRGHDGHHVLRRTLDALESEGRG